jgi:DNA primase
MSKYSPLLNTFKTRGISFATLREFGVSLFDRRGYNSVFNDSHVPRRFTDDRLVFPLYDLYSSFLGLAYRSDKVKFFYDTNFRTRPADILYGLNITHPFVRKSDFCVVVEGPFDFLKLYDSGIKSVVSTLGAGLSWAQMCLLSRLCSRVFLCYDPDAAGRRAANKARSLCLKGGLFPFVVDLDSDPDEFVYKNGPEALLDRCLNSTRDAELDRIETRMRCLRNRGA